MDMSKFWPRKEYSIIEDDEATQTTYHTPCTRNCSSYHTYLLLILLITFSLVAGFFLGQHSSHLSPPSTDPAFPAPPGLIRTAFHYNLTFSRAPSPLTNAAWDALMPPGRGFVRHPTISPTVSVPAVFHQLHCLDGLRKAYYAALEHGSPHEDAAADRRSDTPAHVRHCFDLLRQALMCAADSNLEPVDAALGGVTGWRSERVCRDYGALRRWAEVWKAVPPEP